MKLWPSRVTQGILFIILLLPGAAISNDIAAHRIYRDKYGNTSGYRDRQGDSYTYRDSYGNTTATETRQGSQTVIRDKYGNTIGTYSK